MKYFGIFVKQPFYIQCLNKFGIGFISRHIETTYFLGQNKNTNLVKRPNQSWSVYQIRRLRDKHDCQQLLLVTDTIILKQKQCIAHRNYVLKETRMKLQSKTPHTGRIAQTVRAHSNNGLSASGSLKIPCYSINKIGFYIFFLKY